MPGLAVTGVDISAEMIAIAKGRIQDGRFIVKDIVSLNFVPPAGDPQRLNLPAIYLQQ